MSYRVNQVGDINFKVQCNEPNKAEGFGKLDRSNGLISVVLVGKSLRYGLLSPGMPATQDFREKETETDIIEFTEMLAAGSVFSIIGLNSGHFDIFTDDEKAAEPIGELAFTFNGNGLDFECHTDDEQLTALMEKSGVKRLGYARQASSEEGWQPSTGWQYAFA